MQLTRAGCRYVLWEDGSQRWLNLPRGLHNQLQGSHKARPGVEAISCGDDGQWFVRYLDGHWRAGGSLSESLNETIDSINAQQNDLLSIEMGADGDWALIYA